MEWQASAAARNVDPNQTTRCFALVVLTEFLVVFSSGSFSSCTSPCAGDWKMLKDVFRLPQHNELAGCCWLCPATPITMKDCSTSAPWRMPFTTNDFVLPTSIFPGFLQARLAPCDGSWSVGRYQWKHFLVAPKQTSWSKCEGSHQRIAQEAEQVLQRKQRSGTR